MLNGQTAGGTGYYDDVKWWYTPGRVALGPWPAPLKFGGVARTYTMAILHAAEGRRCLAP